MPAGPGATARGYAEFFHPVQPPLWPIPSLQVKKVL